MWNSEKYNAGGALCILNGLQSGFMEKSRRSKETFSERSAAVKEQCLKMLFCNCCHVSKALLGCGALIHRLKPKNTMKGKNVFSFFEIFPQRSHASINVYYQDREETGQLLYSLQALIKNQQEGMRR